MDELTEKGYLVRICGWLQQQPENKDIPKTDESSMFYHTSEMQYAKLILRFVREQTDSKHIGNCNLPHVINPLSCVGCKYHNTTNDELCGTCGDTYKNKTT